MTIVTKEVQIDMGHRVPNHKSKCKNLHGHRYRIEVGVEGIPVRRPGASDEGMVMDFGDLKKILMAKVHDPLDHGFMMYDNDPLAQMFKKIKHKIIFVPFIPTAENIARLIYNTLQPELGKKRMKLEQVRVWETPTSTAIYRGDDT